MFSRNRDYRNSAALYHMLPAKSIDGTTMGVSAFDAIVCPVKRREEKKGGSRKNVSEIRCKGSSEDSGDITEPRKGSQVAGTDGVERNVITNSSTSRPQSTSLPAPAR